MNGALITKDWVTVVLTGLLWVAEGLVAAGVLALVVRYVSSMWGAEVAERRAVVLAVGAGSVAAAVMTWVVCGGPFLLPGAAGMRTAAGYVLVAGVVGCAAAGVCWRALESRPRVRPGPLLAMSLAGWVMVPVVMMLAMGHSPVAPAAALLVTAMVVVGVGWVVRHGFEVWGGDAGQAMGSLWGMRLDHWAWRSAGVAGFCVAAAVLLAAARWTLTACVVLVVGSAIVLWRWSAALRRRKRVSEWSLWVRVGVAAVASFAAMVLMQEMAPRLGMVEGVPATPSLKTVKAEERHSYFSVVLLPPVEKRKRELTLPREQRPGMRASGAEPVEIPFTGPYWYFQPPLLRPDEAAHVAHGRATEVNVHSVADDLLLMEAHQPLVKAVPLTCCKEIDVAVTNADTGLGLIAVEVVLRDSTKKNRDLMLAPQTLASSGDGVVASHRGQVDEVLRFPMNLRYAGKMKEFDEINVVILPSQMRRFRGTKVEIRTFTLVP